MTIQAKRRATWRRTITTGISRCPEGTITLGHQKFGEDETACILVFKGGTVKHTAMPESSECLL